MISAYLVDIIILLLAAVIAVPLFQLARLGAVPGFLIAGVVVGPYGLGLIGNIEEMGHLAEIGVVLLLFVIGIELKPSRLLLMWRLVFGLGTLQVIVTGALLGGLAYLLFDVPLRAAILVGPALALSPPPFGPRPPQTTVGGVGDNDFVGATVHHNKHGVDDTNPTDEHCQQAHNAHKLVECIGN